jgi:hypothetical protein
MFSEAIKNGMATRKMVEKRLDQQLLNMQVVREENLIIAKREQGEDKEYELTSKEIIDIESECLKKCCIHYDKEFKRYRYEGNEKRCKRMEMACKYLYSLIDFNVNASEPLRRKKPVENQPFPQFSNESDRKASR